MFNRRIYIRPGLVAMLLLGLMAGCNLPQPAASPALPTLAAPLAPTVLPTAVSTPTSASTPIAAQTAASTQAGLAVSSGSQPAVSSPAAEVPTQFPEISPNYLDDRSTPTGLILSYFNAITLKQYLRAYSYWSSPAASGQVPPFNQFQEGYANTDSVQVTLGNISGDAGAGQMYYSVPVVLKAQTTNNTIQTFSGCYILHLSQPGIQTEPPFNPLGIDKAVVTNASNNADPNDLLAHACDSSPQGQPIIPSPVTNTQDITPSNYLDDRSGPIELLSSLFNAVNRKEYPRAYSYWENPGTSQNVPSFPDFQSGYAATDSVQLKTGQVSSGVGAGQIYFTVPAVLIAKNTNAAVQTFSACYTLHLSRPEIQAAPPFKPLAIQSAKAKLVDNGADVPTLLAQACPAQ